MNFPTSAVGVDTVSVLTIISLKITIASGIINMNIIPVARSASTVGMN